jgi:hypothetical protein
VIEDIKMKKDDLTDYLFGEYVPASLAGKTYLDLDRDGNFDAGDTVLSDVQVSLSGTDDRGNSVALKTTTRSDGSYEFGKLRPGTYELQATTPKGLTDGRETLGRFDGMAHTVPENGQMLNDRFANIQLAAGRVGRNYNFGEFDDTATGGILATKFDSKLVIHGTSKADVFEFIGGTSEHTVSLNGTPQKISAAENTQIVFYGHGGNDVANLTGGPGIDQAELRETSAKLTGVSYQVLVYTTPFTNAQSGGGQDRALFYDTAGNDTFYADPLGANLSGAGYLHAANDFHRVYAYTSGGDDSAKFVGSKGDDRFTATENDARMYGDGYYNYARGFGVVHGSAEGGANDRAYFYDSDGADRFTASGNESRLVGATFDNYAHGFDRVYAHASGGLDTATFTDTAASDYYKVDQHGARMYGPGYYNRAIGFNIHFATFDANDGQLDRVAFHDSSGDDAFFASGNQFIASRAGVLHRIQNPDIVLAVATVGRDRALIRSTSFELRTEGDWDPFTSSFRNTSTQ